MGNFALIPKLGSLLATAGLKSLKNVNQMLILKTEAALNYIYRLFTLKHF